MMFFIMVRVIAVVLRFMVFTVFTVFVVVMIFRVAGFETTADMLLFGTLGVMFMFGLFFFVSSVSGFFLVILFFVTLFFEDRAAGKIIGFRAGLRFFVLGLDEAGGKGIQFFVAQASGAVAHGFSRSRFFVRVLVRIVNALFDHVARFCGSGSGRIRLRRLF